MKNVNEVEVTEEVTEEDAAVAIATGLHLMSQIEYSALTNDQLHGKMLEVQNGLLLRWSEMHSYATHELIPVCKEIIARFKMPGVAAKDRPGGMPTVESYFQSIGLNYATVRSWFYRDRQKSVLFLPPKVSRRDNIAAAVHKLINAAQTGVDLNIAISEIEEIVPPPPDLFEGHIEPPSDDASLPRLTMRLVCELESYFDAPFQNSSPPKPAMPKEIRDIVDRLHSELPALLLGKKKQGAARRPARASVASTPRNI